MGGLIAGVRPIDTGTAASPGLPFAAAPLNGVFMPADGGFGIALNGKQFFDLAYGGLTIGYKPPQNFYPTEIIGSPVPAVSINYALAVSPDGAHVVAIGSNVNVFSRNTVTGLLTAVTGSPFAAGTSPQSVAISPNGKFVFVANRTSNDVTIFSRNSLTGFLTPVAGSPFAVGTAPLSVAVSPDGTLLLVANSTSNNLSVFTIDNAGFLTPVLGSPFATGAGPNSVIVSNDNNHIMVTNGAANTLSVFSYSMVQIPGSPFNVETGPLGIVISADNNHVMVLSNDFGAILGSISVFSRNAITGFLTPVAGSPFITNTDSQHISVSNDNNHLVVSDKFNNAIQAYSQNPLTGFLSEIPGGFNTGGAPTGISFSPDNANIYVVNSADNTITCFNTSVIRAYNLISTTFDSSGNSGGSINLNGIVTIQGSQALNITVSDTRYAAITGLKTLPFSASSLKVAEVVNGKQGVATLVAGTVVVANTSITATSRIILTPQETGLFTGSLRVSARTVGVSFTILSTALTDTAQVAYEIFEPG